MNIVNPNAELLKNEGDLYELIEKIGRTCYKSEDKITPGSAQKFVKMLASKQHGAMLEHGYLYFEFTPYAMGDFARQMTEDGKNAASADKYRYMNIEGNFLSVSARAFLEYIQKQGPELSGPDFAMYDQAQKLYPEIFHMEGFKPQKNVQTQAWINGIFIATKDKLIQDIKDQVPSDKQAETLSKLLPMTVKFTCSRGVSHEFVRHRPCAFAQESQRYCNYSKGKQGGDISFIKPVFFEEGTPQYSAWKGSCQAAEDMYNQLIAIGAKPEEARDVLPNACKTEIFITATEKEWQHIVNLRLKGLTGKPHPAMVEVMQIAYPQLMKESEGRIDPSADLQKEEQEEREL